MSKKIRIIFICVLCFFAQNIFAQKTEETKPQETKTTTQASKPTLDWAIEGQLGVFTNGEAFFFNLGGPSIRLKKNRFMISLFVAPTLRVWEDAPRTLVVPVVGTGIEIAYKKIGIAFPMFYNGVKNEWMPTAGLVYKLK